MLAGAICRAPADGTGFGEGGPDLLRVETNQVADLDVRNPSLCLHLAKPAQGRATTLFEKGVQKPASVDKLAALVGRVIQGVWGCVVVHAPFVDMSICRRDGLTVQAGHGARSAVAVAPKILQENSSVTMICRWSVRCWPLVVSQDREDALPTSQVSVVAKGIAGDLKEGLQPLGEAFLSLLVEA